jgi:hypothetical protein
MLRQPQRCPAARRRVDAAQRLVHRHAALGGLAGEDGEGGGQAQEQEQCALHQRPTASSGWPQAPSGKASAKQVDTSRFISSSLPRFTAGLCPPETQR